MVTGYALIEKIELETEITSKKLMICQSQSSYVIISLYKREMSILLLLLLDKYHFVAMPQFL